MKRTVKVAPGIFSARPKVRSSKWNGWALSNRKSSPPKNTDALNFSTEPSIPLGGFFFKLADVIFDSGRITSFFSLAEGMQWDFFSRIYDCWDFDDSLVRKRVDRNRWKKIFSRQWLQSRFLTLNYYARSS